MMYRIGIILMLFLSMEVNADSSLTEAIKALPGSIPVYNNPASENSDKSAAPQGEKNLPLTPKSEKQQNKGDAYSRDPSSLIDNNTHVLNVSFALFVVLVIITVTAWLLKRFGHFQLNNRAGLQIIGGLHMGARERVVLIQVGEQQILLGVAPGRIQTLHVLEKNIVTTQNQDVMPSKFAQRLAAALKR